MYSALFVKHDIMCLAYVEFVYFLSTIIEYIWAKNLWI